MSLATAPPADALPRLAQCANNIDDDRDGKIDFRFEPGCTSAEDASEADPIVPPLCSDGLDNDLDGIIDFPAEPGCRFAADDNEARPGAPPACSNGRDDDRDGAIDYPQDRGCSWAAETSEADTACSDGLDNDSDLKVDFPTDFGCSDVNDANEIDPPECDDGRDNDGDGTLDFDSTIPGQTPDADCESALDTVEGPPPPPPPPPQAAFAVPAAVAAPRCADGVDNDGDARVDFPADAGCSSPADDDEAGVQLPQLLSSSASGRLLLPFPVVRVRGSSDRSGVQISLLTVRAPAASRVTVLCSGAGCPRRSVVMRTSGRIVRVRRLERRLRIGTVLRIYVTKTGFVGKYTRIRFGRTGLLSRIDSCASTAGRAPRPCPRS